MLNNLVTLQIKVLLVMLAGTAVISGVITYTLMDFISPSNKLACPTISPIVTTGPQSSPIPREKYFKVHKSKLNGERF